MCYIKLADFLSVFFSANRLSYRILSYRMLSHRLSAYLFISYYESRTALQQTSTASAVMSGVFAGYRVCSADQIRCRSGQCLGAAQFCSGLVSCADKSVYVDDNVCRQ